MPLPSDIRFITPLDDDFPDKLRDIPAPPSGIYLRGNLPDPDRPSVAIIGARTCSLYGTGAARHFSSVLSEAGVQIISGMARGIDGIAQREAMQSGRPTFAVLGCGLDIVYPKENQDIYDGITRVGGIISEYPPGTPPRPKNFPPRNRIISALCDVLLVIESRVNSGTSITVGWAIEQGRDVFAVPGRLWDPLSTGCNRLISEGAGIALSPYTILEQLGIYLENPDIEMSRSKTPERLTRSQKAVYSILDINPLSLSEIASASRIELPRLLEILLQLQLKGLAEETGCGYYYRKA